MKAILFCHSDLFTIFGVTEVPSVSETECVFVAYSFVWCPWRYLELSSVYIVKMWCYN